MMALIVHISILILWIILAAPFGVSAAEKKAEAKPAARADLSDVEMDEIGRLFGQLAAAFKAGDARLCLPLLAESDQRHKIMSGLEKEFQQVRYLEFEILQILPDDTLPNGHISVDVQIRTKLLALDTQEPAHSADHAPNEAGQEKNAPEQVIENSTTYTFVIQKLNGGHFAIVGSNFLKSLGLRQGMNLVVKGMLAVMALCALLAFQVWMGSEVWWMRPRRGFWRVFVLVPVLGAAAFFIFNYLPNRLRRPVAEATR